MQHKIYKNRIGVTDGQPGKQYALMVDDDLLTKNSTQPSRPVTKLGIQTVSREQTRTGLVRRRCAFAKRNYERITLYIVRLA